MRLDIKGYQPKKQAPSTENPPVISVPPNGGSGVKTKTETMQVYELIREIIDSYELEDTIISYKIKVKTQKSTRMIEFP